MSIMEVSYRLRNKTLSMFQSRGVFCGINIPPPRFTGHSPVWLHETTLVDRQAYIFQADRILEGIMDIFSLEGIKLGRTPNWNQDPKSGTEAPLIYGKTLNYRDENIVGDIKYLWEPNRHLQFVTLCQAYRLTGKIKYLEGFKKLLTSWFEQCPYLMGPNWVSSLELGIRLINWAICWQLIGGNNSELFKNHEGEEFRDKWLTSIFQHSQFINGYWSRYSSANNHLIGEAAGLYVASVTWPFWNKSKRWMGIASQILMDESKHQTHEDGVNREQAISYQQFVADFLLISALCGRASGFEFEKSYWTNLERMMEFLASIMDCNGNVPMIGDADDGFVVKLSQEDKFCPYRSLLITGSVLFNRPDFIKNPAGVDDKTRWLFGDQVDIPKQIEKSHIEPFTNKYFSNGGYYVISSGVDEKTEIRMVVDAGPLGYLSIAAHGHADALAFTLSAAGREFLIDPGTYAYHVKKVWRDYFRGTAAHNTVRIDGCDQSLSGGNFMWLHHANAKCLKWDDNNKITHFEAMHDGYNRLSDPVLHHRSIIFNKQKQIFTIIDTLDCNGEHVVERWWHFSEFCEIKRIGQEIVVSNDGIKINLKLEEQLSVEISEYKGSVEPIAGWISRKFDKKEPSPCVVERLHISGRTVLMAQINFL